MITTDEQIRIHDDTGQNDSYVIDNIVYSDDNIIVAVLSHIDFDMSPIYLTINRHTHSVTSEQLNYYIAENYLDNTKLYVKNGGQLFTIQSIDTLRDGGTRVIKTNTNVLPNQEGGELYIHRLNHSIHYSYPTTGINIIDDKLLIKYIFDRMSSFIKHSEAELERNIDLLTRMKRFEDLSNDLPF